MQPENGELKKFRDRTGCTKKSPDTACDHASSEDRPGLHILGFDASHGMALSTPEEILLLMG